MTTFAGLGGHRVTRLALVIGALVVAGCGNSHSTQTTAAELAFRATVDVVPQGWSGPRFALSADYPTELPDHCPPDVCRWLTRDVDFNAISPPDWQAGGWAAYMADVLAYVREGNDLSPSGWNPIVHGERRWFNMPWMAYDPLAGREFVHGTTNERTVPLSDLVGAQGDASASSFETWAVGQFNPWGGYTVGQSFGSDGVPRTYVSGGRELLRGLPFPTGTLVVKLLFTTATPEQVPFLAGSPEWTVNRHMQTGPSTFSCERQPQTVRLLQVDVSIVDPRSPSRWVLGTFAYDGTSDGATPWDRLAPVGLSWGSDPNTFPAVPAAQSRPPVQSVLAPIRIFEHDGCGGRLNGPVDNPVSSCIACHQGSVAASGGAESVYGQTVPTIFGFDGQCAEYSDLNAVYFGSVVYPDPYPGFADAIPLDMSLQHQVALTQYAVFANRGAPQPCTLP
jgi:hypothetical protein